MDGSGAVRVLQHRLQAMDHGMEERARLEEGPPLIAPCTHRLHPLPAMLAGPSPVPVVRGGINRVGTAFSHSLEPGSEKGKPTCTCQKEAAAAVVGMGDSAVPVRRPNHVLYVCVYSSQDHGEYSWEEEG
ncbi:hypothetical protein BRADI_1g21075v3 [Brachypodium distachyon]|uniref:Uncharacterized protein n=1 Tax=Brachypodium distachyon TaxID=15368 RepID=A0A2K2DKC4_BRADI|nr:hypothetical protein BRADI_1g21075v3 [Brachypodium distachyon]